MEKISIATQLKDIWIPPSGRPYWTTVNSRGNTGSHLTDKELEDRGLSVYKKYEYDKAWAESVNKYKNG